VIYNDNRYDGVRSYWNGNTWVTRVEDAQLYSEKDADAWLGYMAHISGIKKLPVNTWRESAEQIVSTLLEEGPAIQTLKQNQTPLNANEREQAGGHPIKKSVVKGKTYYWSNTHRCYQSATTIAKAVKDYVEIVEPSG
jgi:hypothetical protein